MFHPHHPPPPKDPRLCLVAKQSINLQIITADAEKAPDGQGGLNELDEVDEHVVEWVGEEGGRVRLRGGGGHGDR